MPHGGATTEAMSAASNPSNRSLASARGQKANLRRRGAARGAKTVGAWSCAACQRAGRAACRAVMGGLG
eukprot:2398474-Lingulodinium_polyedra.AAC.1